MPCGVAVTVYQKPTRVSVSMANRMWYGTSYLVREHLSG